MKRNLSQTSSRTTACQLGYSRALCAVCGAPSIGRNFDALTCLSCKAFFRRNAYNDHLTLTCRLSGSCEITSMTRRHCSACRLKKCFEKGMKRELIRSLAAINQATTAGITNLSQRPSIKLTTVNFLSQDDGYFLSMDDWNLITNIRNTYEQYCVQKFVQSHEIIPLLLPPQPYRSRIKIQRVLELNYKYLSIISSFIKRILQFNIIGYSLEPHYSFIKHNFQSLLSINTSELMKSKVLEHFPWEHDQLAIHSLLSEEILQRIERIINTFHTMSPYDPLIMKLFLIILALSSRVSPLMKKDHYQSMDFDPIPQNLLQTQNYYLTLLWKYVVYRLGYKDAVLFSVRFIQNCLRRQTIEADMIEIIQSRNDFSQITQYNQKNFDA